MIEINEAIILCAGLGTRFKPVSDALPKALVPIFSIPLLQFHVDRLIELGIKKLIVNIHHQAEYFRKKILEIDFQGIEIIISDETLQLLSSGGGLATASQYIDGEYFYWVNGDNCMMLPELRPFKDETIQLLLCRVGVDSEYTRILVNEKDKRVLGLASENKEGYFFSGAGIMHQNALRGQPHGVSFPFVQNILQPQIDSQTVRYSVLTTPWMDVGSVYNWYRVHCNLADLNCLNRFSKKTQERVQKNIKTGWNYETNTYIDPIILNTLSADKIKRFGKNLLIYDTSNLLESNKFYDNGVSIAGIWASL